MYPRIPDHVQTLSPYVPGKPIEETQREFKLKKVIKLASNENPLGPSPKALAAYKAAAKSLNLYPDASAFELKQSLSKLLKLPAEWFLIGNGSNEIMDLLMRAYYEPGDSMVTSQAAFVAYQVCAHVLGVKPIETPMTPDFRFDLKAMLEQIHQDDSVKYVFIANPNNPTGTWVTEEELDYFMQEVAKIRGGSVIVALDYAYWEYVTDRRIPDPMKYLKLYSNVVILRTFSKIYGIAGLRLGYAMARPELLAPVQKVRQPFNVSLPALAAAKAALTDKAFVKRAQTLNQQGLKFWMTGLRKLGIPFLPSQGNFLLVNVKEGLGLSGGEVFIMGLKKGVIFRPVTNYGLPGFLRISMGTMAENKMALKVLQGMR